MRNLTIHGEPKVRQDLIRNKAKSKAYGENRNSKRAVWVMSLKKVQGLIDESVRKWRDDLILQIENRPKLTHAEEMPNTRKIDRFTKVIIIITIFTVATVIYGITL